MISADFAHLLNLRIISSPDMHSSKYNSTTVATCSDSPVDSNNLGLPTRGISGMQFWMSKPSTFSGNLPGLARVNLCGQALGLSRLKVVSGAVSSNAETINVSAEY